MVVYICQILPATKLFKTVVDLGFKVIVKHFLECVLFINIFAYNIFRHQLVIKRVFVAS